MRAGRGGTARGSAEVGGLGGEPYFGFADDTPASAKCK